MQTLFFARLSAMYGFLHRRATPRHEFISLFLFLFLIASFPLVAQDTKTMTLFMEGVNLDTQGDTQAAIPYLEKAHAAARTEMSITLTLADAYIGTHAYDKALGLLESAVADNPNDPEALYKLARIYLVRNEVTTALTYFKRAYHIAPSDVEIATTYAGVLSLAGKEDDAIAVLKTLDNPRAYWMLASYYRKKGDMASAEKALRACQRFHANNVTIIQSLSQVLEKEGKYGEAADVIMPYIDQLPTQERELFRIARLLRLSHRYDEAIVNLEKLMILGYDIPEVKMELARCDVEVGRWDEAKRYFLQIKKANPEEILPDIYLVYLTYLSGHFTQSLTIINELERRDLQKEDRVFLLVQKAGILTLTGKFGEAESIYLHLWRDEKVEGAMGELLQFYETTGCYERALKLLFAEEETMDPTQFLLYTARFYLRENKVEMATLCIRGILDLNGEAGYYMVIPITQDTAHYDLTFTLLNEMDHLFPNPHFSLFTRAATLERTGKRGEAKKLFQQLLVKWPDDAGAMNYLAYMWAEEGVNLDQARTLLVKVLKTHPDSGAYLDSMGWILYSMGRYEEAKKNLMKAFQRLPHDPTIIEHLGDTFVRLKKIDEARFYYHLALKCSPDNPDAIIQKIIALK